VLVQESNIQQAKMASNRQTFTNTNIEWRLRPQDLDPQLIYAFARNMNLTDSRPTGDNYEMRQLIDQMQFNLRISQEQDGSLGNLYVSLRRPRYEEVISPAPSLIERDGEAQEDIQSISSSYSASNSHNNHTMVVDGEEEKYNLEASVRVLQHVWFFQYGYAMLALPATSDPNHTTDWVDFMRIAVDAPLRQPAYWKEPGNLKNTQYGGFLLPTAAQQELKSRGIHLFPGTALPVSPPEPSVMAQPAMMEALTTGSWGEVLRRFPYIGLELYLYGRAYRFHEAMHYLVYNIAEKINGTQILENAPCWCVLKNGVFQGEYQVHPSQLEHFREGGAQILPRTDSA
jgi:hypothetical protein